MHRAKGRPEAGAAGTEDEREEVRVFHEHIKRSGLKRTAQRDLILDVFLRTEGHVSSEGLYELVKGEDPTIGFTTVYKCQACRRYERSMVRRETLICRSGRCPRAQTRRRVRPLGTCTARRQMRQRESVGVSFWQKVGAAGDAREKKRVRFASSDEHVHALCPDGGSGRRTKRTVL